MIAHESVSVMAQRFPFDEPMHSVFPGPDWVNALRSECPCCFELRAIHLRELQGVGTPEPAPPPAIHHDD